MSVGSIHFFVGDLPPSSCFQLPQPSRHLPVGAAENGLVVAAVLPLGAWQLLETELVGGLVAINSIFPEILGFDYDPN